jgi:hypothetical protein
MWPTVPGRPTAYPPPGTRSTCSLDQEFNSQLLSRRGGFGSGRPEQVPGERSHRERQHGGHNERHAERRGGRLRPENDHESGQTDRAASLLGGGDQGAADAVRHGQWSTQAPPPGQHSGHMRAPPGRIAAPVTPESLQIHDPPCRRTPTDSDCRPRSTGKEF